MQPGSGMGPGQCPYRLQALKPAITNEAAYDGFVLLLHPSLVVLAIGSRSCHRETVPLAPGDDRIIHERAVVVEVHAA